MSTLTLTIFAPLWGAILIAFIPRRFDRVIWGGAVAAAAYTLGQTLWLFGQFATENASFQFVEIAPWIPSFGISYYVGLDGISLTLVCLTALLSIISLAASFGSIKERRKEFVILFLALETAMIGTFASLDIFLFYVFWEAMLIPMYLLIGMFGGPRRIYATVKFVLFTMAGSVLMLIAILTLYSLHAAKFGPSAALPDLLRLEIPPITQLWMFIAFFVAFAIKIPLFPFHTWLPDAHVEAPTAGSVILAGVLLKMGGYGWIRFAIPLFPEAAKVCAPAIGVLAVVGIVYGAYLALSQEDMKKLIAYSSVSHMGFVALGLASLSPLGMAGAVFGMISHGLTTGALFLLVGALYERRHTRMLEDWGGLAAVCPRLAAVFLVVTLASVGIPGMSGFIGEFLVLCGTFPSSYLRISGWLSGAAVTGVILGAAYMLLVFQRVFLGAVKFEENKRIPDLRPIEVATLLPLVLLSLWLGLQANIVLSRIQPATAALVERVEEARPWGR